MVEHRKVSDVLRVWEERIHKQAQQFESAAAQVLQLDTEIIGNAAKVKGLRTEHAQLKFRQDAVDKSIEQIWEQQDSLGCLLEGLEVALRGKLPNLAVAPHESARTHQRAEEMGLTLDELDRKAEELAKETQSVQSTLYAEPLTTVVRVLDAHASALDAIQSQVGSVAQRIRAVETIL